MEETPRSRSRFATRKYTDDADAIISGNSLKPISSGENKVTTSRNTKYSPVVLLLGAIMVEFAIWFFIRILKPSFVMEKDKSGKDHVNAYKIFYYSIGISSVILFLIGIYL